MGLTCEAVREQHAGILDLLFQILKGLCWQGSHVVVVRIVRYSLWDEATRCVARPPADPGLE